MRRSQAKAAFAFAAIAIATVCVAVTLAGRGDEASPEQRPRAVEGGGAQVLVDRNTLRSRLQLRRDRNRAARRASSRKAEGEDEHGQPAVASATRSTVRTVAARFLRALLALEVGRRGGWALSALAGVASPAIRRLVLRQPARRLHGALPRRGRVADLVVLPGADARRVELVATIVRGRRSPSGLIITVEKRGRAWLVTDLR